MERHFCAYASASTYLFGIIINGDNSRRESHLVLGDLVQALSNNYGTR